MREDLGNNGDPSVMEREIESLKTENGQLQQAIELSVDEAVPLKARSHAVGVRESAS